MTIDNKVAFVCPICGSDDLLFDAYAAWGTESQQWELVQGFPDQGALCHNTCAGSYFDGNYFLDPIKVDLITLSKIKNADEATKDELLMLLRGDK